MKRIIIIFIFTLSVCGLHAQVPDSVSAYSGEWRVHVGGGGSMFKFCADDLTAVMNDAKMGLSGNLGVDYAFFFHPNFSLSLGLEIGLYSGSLFSNLPADSVLRTEDFPSDLDMTEGNFYDITRRSLKETHTAYFLQIPLMLACRYPLNPKVALYATAGGKLGIPLAASHKTETTSTTWGHVDYTGEDYENMPNHGFGTVQTTSKGDITTLKMNFIPSVELGAQWQMQGRQTLYTGLFMDAGYAFGFKATYAWKHQLKRRNKPETDDVPRIIVRPAQSIPVIVAPPAVTVALVEPTLKPMPKQSVRKVAKAVKPKPEPNIPYTNHKISNHFMFEPGSLQMDISFAQNREVLEKLKETIADLNNDTSVVITQIQLNSYSSPDGTFALNKRIADDRVMVWKKFLIAEMSKFELDDNIFTTNAVGEDWAELSRLVKKGNWKDKDKIMKILNSKASPDVREKQLMKLKDGVPFNLIKKELYPQLRRVEYTINYKRKVNKTKN